MVLGDLLIKYVFAPLVVQVLIQFFERCEKDAAFKAKVTKTFVDLAAANTANDPVKEDESAHELQDLIHSS